MVQQFFPLSLIWDASRNDFSVSTRWYDSRGPCPRRTGKEFHDSIFSVQNLTLTTILTLTQSLILKIKKETQKKIIKKNKGEPLGFELQNSLQAALPPCNSPTNCARWKFVANNVISSHFIAHHLNHETIFQSFSDKVLLSYIILFHPIYDLLTTVWKCNLCAWVPVQ